MKKTLLLLTLLIALALAFLHIPSGPTIRAVFIPTSHASDSILGPPTVSAVFLDHLFCTYHSPLCGQGQDLYDLGVRYGVDPVWPAAFAMEESFFGTTGEATVTHSIGNYRCLDLQHYGDLGTRCIDTTGKFWDRCPSTRSCYARFPTWKASFEAFYRLIKGPLYVGAGLTTIGQITQVWAPSSDGNAPVYYACVVTSAARIWRTGSVALPHGC